MNKEHKDPDVIVLEAPRLASYKQKTWKKHQNTVFWVDINLALKKGFKFYQTRSNAIILHETLPSLLYPESCSNGNWTGHIRESIQGVALYGAVALNCAVFAVVASNSALFIHLSIIHGTFFLMSVAWNSVVFFTCASVHGTQFTACLAHVRHTIPIVSHSWAGVWLGQQRRRPA